MKWLEHTGVGAAFNLKEGWDGQRYWHRQNGKVYYTGFGGDADNTPAPDCGWNGQAYVDDNGNWACFHPAGCQPGQVKDIHGNCVSAGVKRGTCGPNQAWNPMTGHCVDNIVTDDDCANDELVDAVTKKCVKMCADGNRPRNGVCPQVPDPVPPPKPLPPGPITPAVSSSGSSANWLIIGAAVLGAGVIAWAVFAKPKSQAVRAAAHEVSAHARRLHASAEKLAAEEARSPRRRRRH